jgi:divinyl chlorophyllide a 8-vinyl-reductase
VLACHGPPYFAQALLNSQKTVVVAGATGYIGRAVVRESVKRGYNTVALVRDRTKLETEQGKLAYQDCFRGASVVECNVQDSVSLRSTLSSLSPQVDTIISCLASPSGIKRDVYAIDYQATLNCLKAGQHASARHFVLLSAFCCRNPQLQLQQAKLKFETELQAQSDLTYSIVRPTAYFKSISAQFESIRGGSPHVLFGDAVTRCNPIAESELAEFMMDCLIEGEKKNELLNIGGPDAPLTNNMLGEVRAFTCGRSKNNAPARSPLSSRSCCRVDA